MGYYHPDDSYGISGLGQNFHVRHLNSPKTRAFFCLGAVNFWAEGCSKPDTLASNVNSAKTNRNILKKVSREVRHPLLNMQITPVILNAQTNTMLQKHRFFSTAGLALSLAMVSDFLGLKSAQVGAIHRLGQLGPALRFCVGSFVDTWSLGDQAALLTRVRLAGPFGNFSEDRRKCCCMQTSLAG